MRLCVAIPCFYRNVDFCDALRRVRALGYDAAETYQWKGLNLDRVRATCDEIGMELLSICTTDFRLTVPEARKDYIEGIRESCEAAKRLGVTRMITQGGPDTGAPREEQHACMVETLKACRPILEDAGVTLMLEPLNTAVNHPGVYLEQSPEAFAICRELDSPNIKVIYDIYHQQISEGNILRNVKNNLDLIAHLHSAGSDGRNELWLGENDYGYIFGEIDKMGYTGACGLEYSPRLDPEESLRLALERYGK